MNPSYRIGETISKTITFDADSVRRFATLAGDMNPLHHDEALAESTRFGGLIVSGTHYSALMMGMVATFLSERRAALGLEFEFQFRKAVAAGETVTMAWRIVAIEPSPKLRGDVVRLDGTLCNAAGDVCVIAKSMSLSLPDDAIAAA
ncbi:MaoC family dehydratase [Burkholderia thailandensis]|uniref:MaoC family dehydratase n=1 Tax=Burkholderia thailandensis TaxID=57975 RepID=UPI00016A4EA3|nr:MaoC family dehydratase [Burkholderia thailandensis]AOI54137.1 dehydratase [Burkholderia thailandensis]